MSVQRARTPQEYADWVKQAKFEAEELHECLMFDLDELSRFPAFIEPLTKGISQVYDDMCNGCYAFGREDFPFMELAEAHADEIPFMVLLRQLNETHRYGLDVAEA